MSLVDSYVTLLPSPFNLKPLIVDSYNMYLKTVKVSNYDVRKN